MTVRIATRADVPALHALAQNVPTAAHWSEKQVADIFAAPPRIALLIEEALTIHGFLVARTSNPDWEIENIVVAETHQRRGLATHLLDALVAQANAAGAEAIFLEVRASNETARTFYEHRAFRASGRRPNYYNDPQDDAILYRRDLLP